MGFLKCGHINVEITNEDKILFPKSKITKKKFVEYYHKIARRMIPYMKNRPVTMHRFPDGIRKEGFYHKDAPEHIPSWVKTKNIKKKEGGSTNYIICNNQATLVFLANYGCITPHIWLSTIDNINKPDRMIFDLDPSSGVSFALVRKTALRFKELLEQCNLKPFVMTTGSKGLHIIVPLNGKVSFGDVRKCAHSLADILVKQDPKHLTAEIRKAKRRGKIFIDTVRNAYAQTGAAPYAVRPYPGAPIAMPISWNEIKNSRLTPQKYTLNNVFKSIGKQKNPWRTMQQHRNSIAKAQKKIETQESI